MSAGSTLLAAYNGEGRRILKESSGGAWQFYLKDGPRTLAVIDQKGLSHMNLFGNALFGRILAMNGALDIANPRRYYLSDHLGSTRAVVDDGGTVLETFDYYPFGLLMPKRSSTTGNTIEKFTGKERDESLNLDYFGARYYDPALGRWHNPDPLAEKFPAWSPYNYALNNPMVYVDPDGRDIRISYGCNDQGEECSEFVFTGDNVKEGRDLNNEFVDQFLNAYEYAVSNGGGENLLEAATNRDITVDLFNRSGGDTQELAGAVFWNPIQGLSDNDNSTVLSPTTALEHEFAHAVSRLTDPEGHRRRLSDTSDLSFPNAEEKRVVTGPEQRTAEALGEVAPGQPTRTNYWFFHPVSTFGPTTNKVNRSATYNYWLNRYNQRKASGQSVSWELRMLKKYGN